ncbi:glutathione binding-like protein [Sphingosinicella soli]|uniref:GST-like protein n=1 Tax=Sphingosinicella soli TaxID=333708 RepID=A0A7W7B5N9_9SPHN|nr:glutathione binding-like protein [Sphingosinicella soli]MBB4633377.1 GST-like protein [Sphingosinicella soli]
MTAPIELYHYPTANPKKISIMLEECDLPYEVRFINIGKGDQFNPDFLKFAPNNRVPAIIDPNGPDGAPISVFESGAILQYLGDKTGRFYPSDLRGRTAVNEWLFWQVGGLGPMSGQSHHFHAMATEQLPYALKRYSDEVHRLYGVMNIRLRDEPYLGGKEYSIADMAAYPWIFHNEAPGHPGLSEFPHIKRWFDTVSARPAVAKGHVVGDELRGGLDEEARKWTFNQRARAA